MPLLQSGSGCILVWYRDTARRGQGACPERKPLGMFSLPETLRRPPMAAWALFIFNHKTEACELSQFHV